MIGGFQPCSFIDYPGRIAAVLFTQGCNLKCRYCHNPQLCSPSAEPAVSIETVAAFLEKRRGKLTGVVVSGGEPTLHNSLHHLLHTIQSMGFPVKLDTNGTRPELVERLIAEKLVDFAAVDVKIAAGPSSLWLCGMENQADSALATLRLFVEAGIACEARTTVVDGLHNPENLSAIAEGLASAGVRAWRLQPVEAGKVLDPSVRLAPPEPELLARALDAARALGINASSRSGMLSRKSMCA